MSAGPGAAEEKRCDVCGVPAAVGVSVPEVVDPSAGSLGGVPFMAEVYFCAGCRPAHAEREDRVV